MFLTRESERISGALGIHHSVGGESELLGLRVVIVGVANHDDGAQRVM